MSSCSSGNTGISGFLFVWPIHEHDTELANLVWKAEAPVLSLEAFTAIQAVEQSMLN